MNTKVYVPHWGSINNKHETRVEVKLCRTDLNVCISKGCINVTNKFILHNFLLIWWHIHHLWCILVQNFSSSAGSFQHFLYIYSYAIQHIVYKKCIMMNFSIHRMYNKKMTLTYYPDVSLPFKDLKISCKNSNVWV